MKYSKNWIQAYLAEPLPADDELDRVLSLYAFEVESIERVGDDSVLDVKVLPNRAGDCLSHRGMARELSALLGVAMREEEGPLGRGSVAVESEGGPSGPAITIDAGVPCRRYVGVVVRGVKVGPSPAWLSARLEAVGQRSINNVVDATNYVMLGYGQPMHAFDLNKLSAPAIRVRMATAGESFTTLSGETKELDERVMLIADAATGEALAMAGVKGGDRAGVEDATTDILIESANFDASAVRYSSRSRNILTDSAKRFEADLDPTLAGEAMERCVSLIVAVAGGVVDGGTDVYPEPAVPHELSFSVERMRVISGLELDAERIAGILRSRGFEVAVSDANETGGMAVTVPTWRRDVVGDADLVEEVLQQYGYDALPAATQTSGAPAELSDEEVREEAARRILRLAGFDEVMSYAFRSTGVVELENPIASDKAFLRADLSSAMRETLDTNWQYVELAGRAFVTVFEIGSVFPKEGETRRVCFGAFDSSKKGALARAAVLNAATAFAAVGVELSVPDAPSPIVEFDVTSIDVALARAYLATAPQLPRSEVRYVPYSPYPVSTRDIALFAPAAGMEAEIAAAIVAAAGPHARVVRLFDRFEKAPDQVSYGFRIAFQADNKTLEESDLVAAMNAVTEAVVARGWTVR